jgi:HTH-type transcriptional repressor of NAD biosynthesis genes
VPITGLTLGKFAPFHKGHQRLIETALAECDELTCVVYDSPEVTDIPLPVRAQWIRTLYPTIRVVEARNAPADVGDTPEIQQPHERYVREELGITHTDRFYSSESYGAHMSRALGALDRRLDPARSVMTISGTAIRSDPFRYRSFLHPLVYRDHVTTAVFLGAPCTGKTTLVHRLAHEFGTVWMPEYGRDYWQRHQVDRRLSPEQLLAIAKGHLEREDAGILEARRYFFVDTNALTTAVFARYYHREPLPALATIADQSASRYDLVFLCEGDFPYQDTWDRSGPANRTLLQRMVVEDLEARGIAAIVLTGPIGARVEAVRRSLERHRKWDEPARR